MEQSLRVLPVWRNTNISDSSFNFYHGLHYVVSLQAMVKDTKLNPMLLPASKLKKLIAAHALHAGKGRCGFRVPNKGLW